MLNHLEMAREVSDKLGVVINAMAGLVYATLEMKGMPSKSHLSALQSSMHNMAITHTQQALSELESFANELAVSEMRRAIEEANAALSVSATSDFPAISNVKDRIVYELCAYASEGVRIANRYAIRVALNYGAGWPAEKAKSLAASAYRDVIAKWGAGRTGVKSNLNHSLFLLIAELFQQVKIEAYILKSMELGATRFRLSQPGHRRDGAEFHPSTLPVDELHPQSAAKIFAVR